MQLDSYKCWAQQDPFKSHPPRGPNKAFGTIRPRQIAEYKLAENKEMMFRLSVDDLSQGPRKRPHMAVGTIRPRQILGHKLTGQTVSPLTI